MVQTRLATRAADVLDPQSVEFRPVTAILRSRARDQGLMTAYRFLNDAGEPEGLLTFRDLDRRARSVAARLERRGARGERVLLLYPPGLDFLVGFFGCLYARAIAVPAYPPKRRKVDARIREIARDSGATVALTTSEVLDLLGGEAKAGEAAGDGRLAWIPTDALDDELPFDAGELEPERHEIAYLQYTSGSTSTPKGVVVSHENLWHNLTSIAVQAEDGVATPEESVAVTWLPHFHDMGLVFGLLTPLYVGFPCHILSPASFLQHPERWLEAMTAYRGTHSAAPNFAYDLCVRKIRPERRAGLELGRWRIAVNGAEPLRPETLDRFVEVFGPFGFRRRAFCPAYGLAEATLMATSVPGPREPRATWLASQLLSRAKVEPVEEGSPGGTERVSCGVGALGMEVAIVDPATGSRRCAGEIGEVWIRGASVAKGYWNRPEETREVFGGTIPYEEGGPFLRTGDLGFVLESELYVTGRVKDVIIVRGRNHYPNDIESTMEKSHSALRPTCGAAFATDVDGEERLVVVQEVERQNRHDDMAEPIQAIRRAILEEHEIAPYAVLVVPFGSVPKTSSGKIQRQACRELWKRGEFRPLGEWREESTASSRPAELSGRRRPTTQTEIENFMIERLKARSRLGVQEVDVSEPFASYGLDSADALELVAELQEYTGSPIAPMLFWNYPTIELLARHLVSARDDTASR